jgi:hypothetical protein
MSAPDTPNTTETVVDSPEVVFIPTHLLIKHVKFCENSKGQKREENLQNMSRAWAGFLDARKSNIAKDELWLGMARILRMPHGKERLSVSEIAKIRDMVSVAVETPVPALKKEA